MKTLSTETSLQVQMTEKGRKLISITLFAKPCINEKSSEGTLKNSRSYLAATVSITGDKHPLPAMPSSLMDGSRSWHLWKISVQNCWVLNWSGLRNRIISTCYPALDHQQKITDKSGFTVIVMTHYEALTPNWKKESMCINPQTEAQKKNKMKLFVAIEFGNKSIIHASFLISQKKQKNSNSNHLGSLFHLCLVFFPPLFLNANLTIWETWEEKRACFRDLREQSRGNDGFLQYCLNTNHN